MLQRSSLWAAALSACVMACSGGAANAPPASEPPATSEGPAGEPPVASEARAAGTDPAVNDAVSAATGAAEAWLQLVDQQQYEQSYSAAAGVFRASLTADAWSKAASGVRGAFGTPLSRKLAAAKYATSLPSAPDGHYVVIQYETSFEKKASAVETVTPMKDSDGVWRVAGYYVK